MPIVDPIAKPAWRIQRQAGWRKRVTGTHPEARAVEEIFKALVLDQLTVSARCEGRIDPDRLPCETRESLGDLYEILTERGHAVVFWGVWERVENELRWRHCQECAGDHPHTDPHNQQSLYYQQRFRAQHGRWPTWSDAMAHCTPEIQARWKEELIKMHKQHKLPIPDDLLQGPAPGR
jgi:hypothetical protein